MKHRGYDITYNPPPIPSRAFDWQFVHKDYDGAPDSGDARCGTGESSRDCIEQIDEILLDQEATNANR